MRRIIVLLAAILVVTSMAAATATAITKTCSIACKGTDGRDSLTGDSSDTHFWGFEKSDEITDTDNHDQDSVKAGAGDDLVNVREGGNASNEVDIVNCGKGHDTVSADFNDQVNANCEVVHRS